FFQAEDGIRDLIVTGVQTCALPIFDRRMGGPSEAEVILQQDIEEVPGRSIGRIEMHLLDLDVGDAAVPLDGRAEINTRPHPFDQIGRASCRERGESWGGAETGENST